VRVLFIDKEGDPARIVDDFRNLGNQIHAIEGEPYVKCQECGLWVQQNKKGNRKYCRGCEKYQPLVRKLILCVDCGDEFEVDGIVKNKNRCDVCYEKHRSQQSREKSKKHYDKKKILTSFI
jgi:hypothetical protein